MNICYEDINYNIVHQCVMCYNKQTTNKIKCAFCGERHFTSDVHFDMSIVKLAWERDISATREWITSVYKQLEDK